MQIQLQFQGISSEEKSIWKTTHRADPAYSADGPCSLLRVFSPRTTHQSTCLLTSCCPAQNGKCSSCEQTCERIQYSCLPSCSHICLHNCDDAPIMSRMRRMRKRGGIQSCKTDTPEIAMQGAPLNFQKKPIESLSLMGHYALLT